MFENSAAILHDQHRNAALALGVLHHLSDIDTGLAVAGGAALQKIHNRLIYSAGLSYVHRVADLRVGVTYTDGIGSGLSFSTHLMSQTGSAPTELFPYVLDSNRIVFARVFAMFWKMYAGVDLEFVFTRPKRNDPQTSVIFLAPIVEPEHMKAAEVAGLTRSRDIAC